MDLLIACAGSSSLKLRMLSPDDEVLDEWSIPDWDGSADAELSGDAIVHRVVHGGSRFGGAVLVDDEVEKAIEECAPPHVSSSRGNFRGEPGSCALLPTAWRG